MKVRLVVTSNKQKDSSLVGMASGWRTTQDDTKGTTTTPR